MWWNGHSKHILPFTTLDEANKWISQCELCVAVVQLFWCGANGKNYNVHHFHTNLLHFIYLADCKWRVENCTINKATTVCSLRLYSVGRFLFLSFAVSVTFTPTRCTSTVLISILPKCVMAFATFHTNKYTAFNRFVYVLLCCIKSKRMWWQSTRAYSNLNVVESCSI